MYDILYTIYGIFPSAVLCDTFSCAEVNDGALAAAGRQGGAYPLPEGDQQGIVHDPVLFWQYFSERFLGLVGIFC